MWSGVASDRWPTHRCIRVLRRVIELQPCPRVIALLRRDQDRKHILVLLRLSAPPHWPLPKLWVFWISAESPALLSSIPFLLGMYIDALESTAKSRSSGDFEVGGVALASIIRIFELVDNFRQVPCHSVGASFLVGFVLCPFRKSGSARTVFVRFHTF